MGAAWVIDPDLGPIRAPRPENYNINSGEGAWHYTFKNKTFHLANNPYPKSKSELQARFDAIIKRTTQMAFTNDGKQILYNNKIFTAKEDSDGKLIDISIKIENLDKTLINNILFKFNNIKIKSAFSSLLDIYIHEKYTSYFQPCRNLTWDIFKRDILTNTNGYRVNIPYLLSNFGWKKLKDGTFLESIKKDRLNKVEYEKLIKNIRTQEVFGIYGRDIYSRRGRSIYSQWHNIRIKSPDQLWFITTNSNSEINEIGIPYLKYLLLTENPNVLKNNELNLILVKIINFNRQEQTVDIETYLKESGDKIIIKNLNALSILRISSSGFISGDIQINDWDEKYYMKKITYEKYIQKQQIIQENKEKKNRLDNLNEQLQDEIIINIKNYKYIHVKNIIDKFITIMEIFYHMNRRILDL